MLRFQRRRLASSLSAAMTSTVFFGACCCSASSSSSSASSVLSGGTAALVSVPLLVAARRHQFGSAQPGGAAAPVGLASNPTEKQFQCELCGKSFRLEGVAQQHIQTAHPGQVARLIRAGGGGGGVAAPSAPAGSTAPRPLPAASAQPSQLPPAQQQQQQQQQQQPAQTAAGEAPKRQGLQQAVDRSGGGRAFAFPTMTAAGTINTRPAGGDEGEGSFAVPHYRREIKRRERRASDPLHRPEHHVEDDVIAQLLQVWDKFGHQRLGAGFISSASVKESQVVKDELDEDVPTYVSMHPDAGDAANPFAQILDGKMPEPPSATPAATTPAQAAATPDVPAPPPSEQTTATAETAESPAPAASAATPAAAAAPLVAGKLSSSPADFADFHVAAPRDVAAGVGALGALPFRCPAVMNPHVASPTPPTRPVVLNAAAQQQQRKDAGAAGGAASSAAALEAASEQDGGAAAGGDDGDDDAPSAGRGSTALDATPSAFAAVMQATSPFSVTESGAPLDAAFGTVSDPSVAIIGGQQQQQQQPPAAATAFAAAAAAPSPFASAPIMSPFVQQATAASPFTAAAGGTAAASASAAGQAPIVASGVVGAPVGPVEAAVDLSSLFGGPSADFAPPKTEEVFACKVCGKNTFKSEQAMIAHCSFKHGITPSSGQSQQQQGDAAKGGKNKKKRILPDLPPYIPSPVDLMATAPYSTTRSANAAAASASTLLWSEVEVVPHARIVSSTTLLGEVTAVGEPGLVQDVPCIQLTVTVSPTSASGDGAAAEAIPVRCFGQELVGLVQATLSVGASVVVEGRLRLNPSYSSSTNKYYADPVVVVASPNGFVTRVA